MKRNQENLIRYGADHLGAGVVNTNEPKFNLGSGGILNKGNR